MRIAVCADLHIGLHRVFSGPTEAGINRRCRLVLDAVRCAVQAAWDARCTHFYVLGDLFDTSRPSPQVLAATIDALRSPDTHDIDGRPPMEVTVLCGNHDQVSSLPEDNAVAVLRRAGIEVVEAPELLVGGGEEDETNIVCLPFLTGDNRKTLPALLDDQVSRWKRDVWGRGATVLLGHFGIVDPATPPWLRDAQDAIGVDVLMELMRRHGIGLTAAGNFHTRQVWNADLQRAHPGHRSFVFTSTFPLITQVGALCPADFGDKPPFGTLAVIDTQAAALEVHEIPGPRFVRCASAKDVLDHINQRHPEGCTFFVRLVAPPHLLQEAQDRIADWKKEGIIADGDVEVDRVAQEAATRAAVAAAAKVATLEEALPAYVGKLELPPNLDRGRIVALCAELLK